MLINLDDDSYPVVAQKNIDERLYPASLTKKMCIRDRNKSKKDCFMYNFYAWSNVFYFYTME